VQRTPAARQQVLDRQLHRVAVEGGALQVEKAFVYLDRARGQAFLVQPPRERYRHADASAALQRMLGELPDGMGAPLRQRRVVFGLEELREKLVAADAGLDDRAVELMKAAIVHDHPVLLARARLRLSLDHVDARGAHFVASYDHSPKAFGITYETPELLCGDERPLKAWSAALDRHDLFKLDARGDHWVNYRRWLPSQDAVAELHRIVLALGQGQPPDPASAAFRTLLARLPRGTALSGQAKKDLRSLFLWAKAQNQQKLQDELFELRFGIALEDAWYRNSDKDDIDTLWRLLKNPARQPRRGQQQARRDQPGQRGRRLLFASDDGNRDRCRRAGVQGTLRGHLAPRGGPRGARGRARAHRRLAVAALRLGRVPDHLEGH
jgi:hypothetical protein